VAGTYATGSGSATGTNTGDQTSITGNAGTATLLSAGADRTKLDAITGTNTGNETSATIKTALGITTLSGSNTGDQVVPVASSTTPAALGTATVGVGTTFARADHAHAAPTSVSGNAGSATNLAGGAGGQIPYQTASGATALLANGTASQVLQSNGTTLAPSWVTPSAGGGSSVYYEVNLGTPATSVASPTATDVTGTLVTAATAGTYRATLTAQFAATPGLVAAQCSTDLNALIAQINALTGFVGHAAAYGTGEVLLPGRYYIAGATTHTGNLTFDAQGDSTALWIMKCGAAHAIAAAATVSLVNGAKASNIFWLIVGAPTIGASCTLKGTYIGMSAIAPGDVFDLEGRVLTTTGGVTTSNTTYKVPVGDPPILNLGILKSFVFFTPAGAISNTVVTGGVGDIATGGGAVTGFGTINGTVYLPTDVNTKVSFGLYANDVLIPNSTMYTESRLYGGYLAVSTAGQAVVTAGQKISAKVQVNVGSVIVANRTLYATKVA